MIRSLNPRAVRTALRWGAVLTYVFASVSPALALNPALDVSQYVHTSWKIGSSFVRGTIGAIAQTPDGYLWLGTEAGLFRFDGVRAVPWRPPLNELPSDMILSLLAGRDGTLWIGTDRGMASWEEHAQQFRRYDALSGSFVPTLAEDADGSIWMTRFLNEWALCTIQQTRVHCYGEDGGPGANALGVYRDSKGGLWVGSDSGVWQWQPGPPRFFQLPAQDNGYQGFSEDEDGSLLIAQRGGILRLVDGRAQLVHRYPASAQPAQALKLHRDRDGGLWIATSTRGLLHAHHRRIDVFSQADGLSGNRITAVYEDREGTIWVATGNGLDRFREPAIVSYTSRQGLSNDRVMSVLASADGSTWVGTFDGVDRWTNGQVRRVSVDASMPTLVHSMFEDTQHRVWLSSRDGVSFLQNDRLIPLSDIRGGVTRAIVEDGGGTVWIAHLMSGLFRVPRGAPVEQIPWAALNRKDVPTAVAGDASGDGVWIGFYQGGLSYFSRGQVRASYDTSHGLAPGRVSALHVDAARAVWVATDGGLSLVKDGRITTLTTANGLPCNAAGWVIDDAAGSLWVGMPCGLTRIARHELDAWVAARESGVTHQSRLNVTVFDHSDGARTFVNAIYYTAPVARSKDGKLWFVSQDGLSVVDPTRLPRNPLPPPVYVEQIIGDRNTYRAGSRSGPVQLPPLIRDLQIDYTALSFVEPEKMRFRYKLEGHDADWQEVGTRRQAFYNDLDPGTYRFRVMASNNSGVWNEGGATLDFVIAAAYYQTAWFMTAAAVAIVTLVWAAHRVRLRIVETHEREITALNEQLMSAQEQERIRIAGELHDGVMQEMLAATMLLGSAKRRVDAESEAHATIDKVQEKLVRAGAEIRQLSHDLHPPALQDTGLPDALRLHCEQFSASCGIKIDCDADDSVHELSRGAALALFRIVQEALANAAKHSRATRIVVGLTRDGGDVTLTVSDNGIGFDRSRLTTPSGLGLITMRERAGQLNGRFEFNTTLGQGTIITVVVPFR